jgi:hypothetical protein
MHEADFDGLGLPLSAYQKRSSSLYWLDVEFFAGSNWASSPPGLHCPWPSWPGWALSLLIFRLARHSAYKFIEINAEHSHVSLTRLQ